jgi:DNA recombination protein RmuC
MVEHCDFHEQVHTTGDEKSIRPDMIVRMPDHRELVVDVKTPLDAYLEAVEAKDDAQRKQGLERHTRNVRDHIRKLASKTYWEQFSKSPEFVILFIPGDQFLSAALNEDPDLIEYALSQQIILATPTLNAFVGHMNKVGKQLASSVENYNRAVGSLERKVLPGARKFVELGIRPKKEIEQVEPLESLPRSIVETGNDSDDDTGDKTLQ